MLVEILRGDRVAADRCLLREGEIPLKNLMRAAANFYAGAVAVKSFDCVAVFAAGAGMGGRRYSARVNVDLIRFSFLPGMWV